MTSSTASLTTIDPAEVARFARIAESWWDPDGDFRPLHRFNPIRLGYIRDRLIERFGLSSSDINPLQGLTLLDIGCGGGLVAEPMARLGAAVTGIDATARNVAVAALHAEQSGLAINYREAAAETLVAEGAQFDIVLSLEVVEHVADRALFLSSCAALVKPGGALIVATLNRTAKSFALAIVGAEYILQWLPRGTHEWRKFVRPHEVAADLRANGMEIRDMAGAIFDPLRQSWSIGSDLDVNYLVYASKA
jgi:2-polyprenyl-6-hydroxyphenyl methylase/3-demethylubiquinone-9 3-methyltransferase